MKGKRINVDLELPLEGEIKYLNIELGKLKSYIAELEYKNRELIKIGKKFEKEKNIAESKVNKLLKDGLTKSEIREIAKELKKESLIKDLIEKNEKLIKEIAKYEKLLSKKENRIERIQYEKWFCEYLQLKERYNKEQSQNKNNENDSQNI